MSRFKIEMTPGGTGPRLSLPAGSAMDHRIGTLAHVEDELPPHVAALDAVVRFGGSLERQDVLDRRAEPAGVGECRECTEVGATRADDVP